MTKVIVSNGVKNLSLNYVFKDEKLKSQALTHRSASQSHNERLEFLGDALVGLIVADHLFKRFPDADEGQLTRLRARVVNSDALYSVGQQLGISDMLILGEGEKKTGGAKRVSISSDAVEALIGAIYLDSNFDTCSLVVQELLADVLGSLDPDTILKDPKTALQEFLQSKNLGLPLYHVESISGPPHDRYFKITCSVKGLLEKPVIGAGESRRKAEQASAKAALSLIFEKEEHD